MAKHLLILVALFVALSCSGERTVKVTGPPPREAIGVQYVSVPELEVREAPSDTSAVISTYVYAEPVSILAKQGEWVEVRVGVDRSGWVHASDLAATREGLTSNVGEPVARFVTPPSPIPNTGNFHGEVVLEAQVSIDGVVTDVRTLSNTTGSEQLEALNRASLQRSRFYPMIVNGNRKPFVYDYRVEY